jgi:Mn-dependent DtxR family transcriptional regulator
MSIAGPVFTRLGFTAVRDANTAGSIAVVAGFLFATVVFLAPHQGLAMRMIDRWKVAVQITADDVLGELYRRDEGRRMIVSPLARTSSLLRSAAIKRLLHSGAISTDERGEYRLSPSGLTAARELVRTHRLWESYLDQNFSLPADQLHLAADRAEHFLDPSLRKELAAEVPLASVDPHGRNIPEAPPHPER